MSELIVHGLKNCDTCRKALAALRERGVAHRFIDYRDQPIDPATLLDWSRHLGGFSAMVNRSGTTWRQLPQERKTPADDAQWLQLLAEFPALLRRPLVLDNGKVRIGLPTQRTVP